MLSVLWTCATACPPPPADLHLSAGAQVVCGVLTLAVMAGVAWLAERRARELRSKVLRFPSAAGGRL